MLAVSVEYVWAYLFSNLFTLFEYIGVITFQLYVTMTITDIKIAVVCYLTQWSNLYSNLTWSVVFHSFYHIAVYCSHGFLA